MTTMSPALHSVAQQEQAEEQQGCRLNNRAASGERQVSAEVVSRHGERTWQATKMIAARDICFTHAEHHMRHSVCSRTPLSVRSRMYVALTSLSRCLPLRCAVRSLLHFVLALDERGQNRLHDLDLRNHDACLELCSLIGIAVAQTRL